jgi:hypothetical protein
LTKTGLGYILGEFVTNSSGRPAKDEKKIGSKEFLFLGCHFVEESFGCPSVMNLLLSREEGSNPARKCINKKKFHCSKQVLHRVSSRDHVSERTFMPTSCPTRVDVTYDNNFCHFSHIARRNRQLKIIL